MNFIILMTQWLLVLFFCVAGVLKLVAHPHMVQEFKRFGYPYGLARLAGALEVIAACLLAFGAVAPAPAWVSAGAWLLVPVMMGAAYTNFMKRPPAFGWGTLVILLLCLVPAMYYLPDLVALLGNWIFSKN